MNSVLTHVVATSRFVVFLSLSTLPVLSHAVQMARTADGCGVMALTQKKISEVSWTGECGAGKGTGSGVLLNRVEGGGEIRYEGLLKDGLPHGPGKWIFDNGDIKSGNWVSGDLEGLGTYVWADGGRYEGNWKNSKRTGYGVETYPAPAPGKCTDNDAPCRKIYRGTFVEGTFKCGRLEYNNAQTYEGCWDSAGKKACHSSTATPLSRFVIAGDEAKDTVTDLTWKRCPQGTRLKRGDGLSVADTCEGSPSTDKPRKVLEQIAKEGLAEQGWRLPTIQELISLVPGLEPNEEATSGMKTNNPLGLSFMGGGVTTGCPGPLNPEIFPAFSLEGSFYTGSTSKYLRFNSSSIDMRPTDFLDRGSVHFWTWGPGLGGRNVDLVSYYSWDSRNELPSLLVKGTPKPNSLEKGSRPLFNFTSANGGFCTGSTWTPDARYRIEDDVVLDKQTGLRWRRCAEGINGEVLWRNGACTGKAIHISWRRAVSKYPISGNGWRLPTIDELLQLRSGNADITNPTNVAAGQTGSGCVGPAYNANFFAIDTDQFVISSSLNLNDAELVRGVNFSRGSSLVTGRKDIHQVLLVQGPIKPGPLALNKWATQPTADEIKKIKAEIAEIDERQRIQEEQERREAQARQREYEAEQARRNQNNSGGYVTCWRSEIDSCYSVIEKRDYGKGIRYTLKCHKGMFQGERGMHWEPNERQPFCAAGSCSLPRIGHTDPHRAAADACGFFYNGD